MAEVLAVGTTAANSLDVAVGDGEELTVCLKDVAGPRVAQGAFVDILLKDDAGEYFRVDALTANHPAKIIGTGTYRFSRRAGISCGVFSA